MWWILSYVLLAIVLGIALLLAAFLLWSEMFWKDSGFQALPATFILKSMIRALFVTKSNGDVDQEIYEEFVKTGVKVGGVVDFIGPNLWILDPDLMRLIFVKDFDHFVDRQTFDFGDNEDLNNKGLPNLTGQLWKHVRKVVNPIFTSGNMKNIFQIISTNCEHLVDYIYEKTARGEHVEMKDTYARLVMDVIASSAFGVDCNSFRDPNVVFSQKAKKLINPGAFGFMLMTLMLVTPSFVNLLQKLRIPLPEDVELSKYFANMLREAIAEREQGWVKRNDLLQLLLDARKGELEEDGEFDTNQAISGKDVLTEAVVIAQCVTFFMVGYETTGSTLSFAAYELACHQDIQEKLYLEVKEAANENGGQLTYNSVMKMEYLDKVIREVLRLHAPTTRNWRKCTKDYQIPGTGQVIRKGTLLTFPFFVIHRDERYYPNPTKFDPERFSPDEKAKRHQFVYQPFGHGPRNCIGMRFALMETKTALASTVLHYQLQATEKTVFPMQYAISMDALLLSSKFGIWLRMERREYQ